MARKTYAIPRFYEKLGAFLREARLAKGYSQKEIADALGYSSAQFISNFECGIAVPPLPRMKIMIKLYGLNLNTLMDHVLDAERYRMKTLLTAGKQK